MLRKALSFVAAIFLANPASSDQIQVAVASNFAGTMDKIVAAFEAQSNHKVGVSLGSSGKLYAQIMNAAPFDLFLSADQSKPERLAEYNLVVNRHTYAIGRLAIWMPTIQDQQDWQARLAGASKIALANPRVAPYGVAAEETLTHLNLLEATRPKWVVGENIGQAYQFVRSGNVDVGIVALSQLRQYPEFQGSVTTIPETMHKPIAQDVVLLKRGAENKAAVEFYQFLLSNQVQELVRADGYDLP